jgi:glycosyltransferase involved in cell wall biosynthesis
MRVSIALAAYNGSQYLGEQLDSILTQTYTNFELVICDDCSTDDTWSIIQKYAMRDKRISCQRNQKNLGFKKNFEKAISLCQGDYIALSDQDDIWTQNHLSVLLEHAEPNTLIVSKSIIIGTQRRPQMLKAQRNWQTLHKSDKDELLFYLLLDNFAQGCTILFSKTLLCFTLPFPEQIPLHDNWLALVAALQGKIIILDNITVLYRKHATNLVLSTEKKSIQQKQIAWLQRSEQVLNTFLGKFGAQLTLKQKKFCTDFNNYLQSVAQRKNFVKQIRFFFKYRRIFGLNMGFTKFLAFVYRLVFGCSVKNFL